MFWWWLFIFLMGLISALFYKKNVERALKSYKPSSGEDMERLRKVGKWGFILIGIVFTIVGFLGMLNLLPKR